MKNQFRRRVSGSILLISTSAGLIPAIACRKDSADANKHLCPIVCVRCGASGAISVSGPIQNEPWPKECPSCKRWGAYAYAVCAHCGKPVPLIETRSRGYGEPSQCPHCGHPWSAATSAPGP